MNNIDVNVSVWAGPDPHLRRRTSVVPASGFGTDCSGISQGHLVALVQRVTDRSPSPTNVS